MEIGGRSIGEMSMAELARCRAVLPQQSTLAFPFAVREVVLLGRLPFNGGIAGRADMEIADDAMGRTGTLHLRERLYTTLSGGERQRVQLARVLAQTAGDGERGGRCLFLDEPTASLDLAHQHGTLAIARRMAADGCGVLAILHDLNLAAAYADRVAILHDGRIIVSGSPGDVLTPEVIARAFGIAASIIDHPDLDAPVVIAGGEARSRNRIHNQSHQLS
jgi:iron complex transport system ATP-binding protein